MARTASSSRLSGDFDRFLFEPIGQDRNGMPLSVASALARMDLDAWQEAATLVALPAETAVKKLTALLDTIPDQSLMELNRPALVTRLIALLPSPARSNSPSPPIAASAGAFALPRVSKKAILFTLGFLVLLISQFAMSLPDSPTLGGPPTGSTSPTVAPQDSPTISVR